MRYFIAVYTNKVKAYCDREFFMRTKQLPRTELHVVDNTIDMDYYNHLGRLGIQNLYHVVVDEQPKRTQFLRNVTQSVNHLRDIFLAGSCDHFIIIESDVMVSRNLIDLFESAIVKAKDWAAIGGYYYLGFHDFNKAGIDRLEEVHHVLSGCTIYNRDMISVFNFRYDDKENIGAFPDAWWCHDVKKHTDKKLYNYCKIVCKHRMNSRGLKGHEEL
jgi:hypothetical protein